MEAMLLRWEVEVMRRRAEITLILFKTILYGLTASLKLLVFVGGLAGLSDQHDQIVC